MLNRYNSVINPAKLPVGSMATNLLRQKQRGAVEVVASQKNATSNNTSSNSNVNTKSGTGNLVAHNNGLSSSSNLVNTVTNIANKVLPMVPTNLQAEAIPAAVATGAALAVAPKITTSDKVKKSTLTSNSSTSGGAVQSSNLDNENVSNNLDISNSTMQNNHEHIIRTIAGGIILGEVAKATAIAIENNKVENAKLSKDSGGSSSNLGKGIVDIATVGIMAGVTASVIAKNAVDYNDPNISDETKFEHRITNIATAGAMAAITASVVADNNKELGTATYSPINPMGNNNVPKPSVISPIKEDKRFQPQSTGKIAIKGKEYDIYVPPHLANSNDNYTRDGWKTVKTLHTKANTIDLLKGITSVTQSNAPDGIFTIPDSKMEFKEGRNGDKVVNVIDLSKDGMETAAAASALIAFNDVIKGGSEIRPVKISLQQKGNEERAIVEIDTTGGAIQSQTGKNIIITDESKNAIKIHFDEKHKSDPYTAYLSKDSMGNWVVTPKTYGTDSVEYGKYDYSILEKNLQNSPGAPILKFSPTGKQLDRKWEPTSSQNAEAMLKRNIILEPHASKALDSSIDKIDNK